MKSIAIGNKIVGPGSPALFIAEIGLNHQGEVAIAKRLIDMAADCGADVVKFQKRDAEAMMIASRLDVAYDNPNSFGATYRAHREALEFGKAEYQELKEYSQTKGLVMIASIWDEPSADFIEELDLPAFKIASADLTNLPLLKHVAQKGRPIILSTGMASMSDVELAVRWIEQWNKDLVILYCVSTYPSAPADLNLNLIGEYQTRFPDYPIGYSGHETGIATSTMAVVAGAKVVERHITLDRAMKGGDHAASLERAGLERLVRDIRLAEEIFNNQPKTLLPAEQASKEKLAKSVVATTDIPAGTVIAPSMLGVKSPGSGLAPKYIYFLPGQKALIDIGADTVITQEMVEMPADVSDERLFQLAEDRHLASV
jgi:sialic acid synthase